MRQQARSLEEIARKQLADGRLHAPASGVVSRKGIEPGQTVAPGIEVLRLLDVSSVKMTISVPEREIGSMAIGTEGTASDTVIVESMQKVYEGCTVEVTG